jgi:hypothetical protein
MISSAQPMDVMHEQLCRLMIWPAKCLFGRNRMRFGVYLYGVPLRWSDIDHALRSLQHLAILRHRRRKSC